MPQSRNIVRVFLASPSDMPEERHVVKAVVDDFNITWAQHLNYQIELVGWEDTVTRLGRPQATINRDMETCELFIGMLWKHWGSPPDRSGRFGSGFEEEFTLSLDRHRKSGEPEMMLFCKRIEPTYLVDPGPSLTRVLDFKKQIVEEKIILFEEFETTSDLSDRVRKGISRYVQSLDVASEPKLEALPVPTDPGTTSSTSEEVTASLPTFLVELVRRESSGNEPSILSALDVARLRAVASTAETSQNDTLALGVHDANLLYAELEGAPGKEEGRALVLAGLANFISEVVPLWRWLPVTPEQASRQLALHASFAPLQSERQGAFRALRLLESPLPQFDGFGRQAMVKKFLSSENGGDVKSEAMIYLEETGIPEDLDAIDLEINNSNSTTLNRAISAKARILDRQDRGKAVTFLLATAFESLDDNVVADILGPGISETQAREGLSHRSAQVRLISLQSLLGKGLPTNESLERLLSDSSHKVRFTALEALRHRGIWVSQARARQVLVKNNAANSLLGYDWQGNEAVDDFMRDVYLSIPLEQLRGIASEASIYNSLPRSVLTIRSTADPVRAAISQIEKDFDGLYEEEAAKAEAERSTVEFTRTGAIAELMQLAISNNPSDEQAKAIVDIIDREHVDISELQCTWMHKRARAIGTDRLLKMGTRIHSRWIMSNMAASYRVLAEAVIISAAGQIENMIEKIDHSALLREVIRALSSSDFKKISRETTFLMLQNDHTDVRKTVAIKMILSYTRKELQDILNRFMKLEANRYYNVIHWLDLGVALSAKGARQAARKALVI